MLEETADLRMSGDGTAPADPNGTVSAFASGASTPGGRPRSALSVACWRGVRSVASALDRLDARWEALCAAVSRGLYNFKLRYMQPVHRVTLPPWRRRCLKVVSSAWFNNGMTALIIVNTAALGMEHYGMSKQWLAVIDLINMGKPPYALPGGGWARLWRGCGGVVAGVWRHRVGVDSGAQPAGACTPPRTIRL